MPARQSTELPYTARLGRIISTITFTMPVMATITAITTFTTPVTMPVTGNTTFTVPITATVTLVMETLELEPGRHPHPGDVHHHCPVQAVQPFSREPVLTMLLTPHD